ncbi:hypothetical protein SAMN04488062_11512 [Flavobacterium omnivorum]|uniref:Uncharacterized protein n=1 Tax=Flavobacterium omnivorum TaxID=178355 RepID=A0A1G8FEL8_9FLAO|nr:hypothetical protein [Flavobacterium omnivorum]SDH80550.1 hypothetical protein SAMN04488062_11512 [Flavobacterium omnivorum]
MKIKVGNWKIDSNTLVRVEWKKYYPKLIVHEKYEKYVKWTLRALTVIGILLSFLILPYEVGIILTFILFFIGRFFEKTLFEYSVMILQPFSTFEVEYDQWLTNGYFLLNPEIPKENGYLNYFGPAYAEKEYAIKFFKYIKSWNLDEDIDEDNNICISFILEEDSSYSTFLYSNPKRKWINNMFNEYENAMKVEKYGKSQQSTLIQMIYWNNLKISNGMFFTKFLDQQKNNENFFFAPFYIENKQPVLIDELKILKMDYKVKHRKELTKTETEYYYK